MATTVQEMANENVVKGWQGFNAGLWQGEINVRDFIQQNYDPYEEDSSFLAGATERTRKIWDHLNELFVEERKKGRTRHFANSQELSQRMGQAISINQTK